MIRDGMLWIAEGLFGLMGGVPLMDTWWILVWIVAWCLVMVSPMLYMISVRPTWWAGLGLAVVFFPALFMAIGPGIVQAQMLSECKNETVSVATELAGEQELSIRQCRYKGNYYGDFGEWKVVAPAK